MPGVLSLVDNLSKPDDGCTTFSEKAHFLETYRTPITKLFLLRIEKQVVEFLIGAKVFVFLFGGCSFGHRARS